MYDNFVPLLRRLYSSLFIYFLHKKVATLVAYAYDDEQINFGVMWMFKIHSP